MNKQDQPETIAHLARLYGRTPAAFYRAVKRGRLQVWRSNSLRWSTRRAVEKYLKGDKRRKENKEL